VHRNTISRAPGSRGVQDFLREALRVIKAAERLVSEGRSDDLLRYVASIEAGAAG
jgi:hypothetical protein